jgi:N-acetyl-anhydromuramyl-L-alanine amidase AmpD
MRTLRYAPALVCFLVVVGGSALVAQPAAAATPSYYPPTTWIPAARSNYDVGRSAQITTIVIHETGGSYTSAIHWFQNPYSLTSAHYLVTAWTGQIIQFVAESDTAYHARSANPYTIGIEHEYSPYYGIWHTEAQYRASAQLVCAIARHYNIPVDRDHIVGHNELPDNNHSDPGPYWNWDHYMSLVRACATPRAQTLSRGGINTMPDAEYVPAAGLEVGAASPEVALLQWDLAYLGYLSADDLAVGSGRFGDLTLAALTAYQEANGLPPTGFYGDQTAAALSQAIIATPSSVPAVDLEWGDESDDVTTLQTMLGQLGYMDLVTGYFGDITADAVSRFQQDNGIDVDGNYGPVTRMALATRTK